MTVELKLAIYLDFSPHWLAGDQPRTSSYDRLKLAQVREKKSSGYDHLNPTAIISDEDSFALNRTPPFIKDRQIHILSLLALLSLQTFDKHFSQAEIATCTVHFSVMIGLPRMPDAVYIYSYTSQLTHLSVCDYCCDRWYVLHVLVLYSEEYCWLLTDFVRCCIPLQLWHINLANEY